MTDYTITCQTKRPDHTLIEGTYTARLVSVMAKETGIGLYGYRSSEPTEAGVATLTLPGSADLDPQSAYVVHFESRELDQYGTPLLRYSTDEFYLDGNKTLDQLIDISDVPLTPALVTEMREALADAVEAAEEAAETLAAVELSGAAALAGIQFARNNALDEIAGDVANADLARLGAELARDEAEALVIADLGTTDGQTAVLVEAGDASLTGAALIHRFKAHLGAPTADDTARINALAEECRLSPGGGQILGGEGAIYPISNRLVQGSGVDLDLLQSGLKLLPGSDSNMITTYAKANTAATGTGSIAAGSDTVTTALASVAQIGQTLLVAGAGSSLLGAPGFTPSAVLTGVISGVNTGAGTVTLRKLSGEPLYAGITVVGAVTKLITRDKNMRLRIGWLDRGANGGTTVFDTNSLFLRHVDVLELELGKATSTGGKYTAALGDISDYWVSARDLDVHSDGVHLTAAYGGHIDLIEGHAGEDLLSVTCNDYSCNSDISGDVDTWTIGNIRARRQSIGQSLLLLAQSGGRIANGKVLGHIEGTATHPVRIGGSGDYEMGTYEDIDLGTIVRRRNSDQVVGGSLLLGCGTYLGKTKAKIVNNPPSATATTSPPVKTVLATGAAATTFEHLDIELINGAGAKAGVVFDYSGFTADLVTLSGSTKQTVGTFLQVSAGTIKKLLLDKPIVKGGNLNLITLQTCTIDSLTWRGGRTHMAAGTPKGTILITSGALIKAMTFDDARWSCDDTSAGYPVQVVGTPTIGNIVFRGGYYDTMRAMVLTSAGGGAGAFGVVFNGITFDGSRLCDFQAAGAMRVHLTNVTALTMAAPPINLSGATVTVTGEAPLVANPTIFVQRAASEAVRINAPGVKADVSILTPQNNDRCCNTTTAGPGATECVYTNSATPAMWVPLNGYVREGTATLVAGTVTVSNGTITANSDIEIFRVAAGGTLGHLSLTKSAGVSFTINSSSATDTSTVRYRIRSY